MDLLHLKKIELSVITY